MSKKNLRFVFLSSFLVFLSVFATFLAFLTTPAIAADFAGLTQRVEQMFSNLESLQGEFSQQVRDADGQLINETSGKFAVQRPGKFRWHTQTPFEQLVVGDGKKIWVYDADLEQVVVQPQTKALENTLARVLIQKEALQKTFTLRSIGKRSVLEWVELTPKQEAGSFSKLWIAIQEEKIAAILLHDHLGQETRINFADVQKNGKLKPDLFQFTLPEGVDLVGDP